MVHYSCYGKLKKSSTILGLNGRLESSPIFRVPSRTLYTRCSGGSLLQGAEIGYCSCCEKMIKSASMPSVVGVLSSSPCYLHTFRVHLTSCTGNSSVHSVEKVHHRQSDQEHNVFFRNSV